MTNLAKERPIPGTSQVIPPAPLKTYRIEGSKYIEVKDVDLSKYKLIGMNKDYIFYSIK